MTYGFIYCLGNEAMPGIYKIGMTERAPSQRCEELSSSTSAPLPFDLLFYGEVEDPLRVERQIHSEFYLERVNDYREFFRGRAITFKAAISEWCNSIATTEMGDYYLNKEEVLYAITQAASDVDRVQLFASAAKSQGIVMWCEEDRIQFNVTSLGMVPQWILVAAAASKSILIEHLPKSCPLTTKPRLAIVARTEA